MDGVERTQPPLEVNIVHRELLVGEEEQKAPVRQEPCLSGKPGGALYLLTPQNKGSGLIEKKTKMGPGEKIQIDDEYS